MSAVRQPVDAMAVLARAHALVDELACLDLTGCTDEALEGYWREKERLARRLPSLDHALVQEVETRGLPYERAVRTTAQYLRWLLRLEPTEAHGRVQAAQAAARRRSLVGEVLPARFEAVAAAQGCGSISERHARIVVSTIDKLPAAVRDGQGAQLESQLVGYATQFDSHQLSRLARRMAFCFDQDGTLTESTERDRQRELTLHQRPDGSATLTGALTAEATELLLTHLDAYAAPRPPVDGVKDPRSAGQRRHDALLEALKANLRAKQLPTVAGVTATIIATMTTDQYLSGDGLARTSHGAQVPASDVLTWAGGDYRLLLAVLDTVQGVTHYSSTRRLFSENQRLVRHAIDGGCTFPDCPTPALWCEVDHTIDYAESGTTDVRLAGLACDYDNRERKKQGWRPVHIQGRVAWIPPRWIDPEQTPRFNNLHRPDDLR